MPEASLQKTQEPENDNPLKIEPRRLVITGDKPTAMFTVKNSADTDFKVIIKVPDGKMEVSFGETKSDQPYSKDLKSQESVEVHLNLTSSELEKLKKEGILKDEEVQVECTPNGQVIQTVKLIVAFSDKEITKEVRTRGKLLPGPRKPIPMDHCCARGHYQQKPYSARANMTSKLGNKKRHSKVGSTVSHSSASMTTGSGATASPSTAAATASTVTPTTTGTTSTPGTTGTTTPAEEEEKKKKCVIM